MCVAYHRCKKVFFLFFTLVAFLIFSTFLIFKRFLNKNVSTNVTQNSILMIFCICTAFEIGWNRIAL